MLNVPPPPPPPESSRGEHNITIIIIVTRVRFMLELMRIGAFRIFRRAKNARPAGGSTVASPGGALRTARRSADGDSRPRDDQTFSLFVPPIPPIRLHFPRRPIRNFYRDSTNHDAHARLTIFRPLFLVSSSFVFECEWAVRILL